MRTCCTLDARIEEVAKELSGQGGCRGAVRTRRTLRLWTDTHHRSTSPLPTTQPSTDSPSMSNFMFNQQQQQPHYGGPTNAYYDPQAASPSNLQFYSAGGAPSDPQFYSRPSLEGNMASGGGVGGPPPSAGFGGSIQGPTGWLSAFSSAGFEGEPPLLEGTCNLAMPRLRR